MPWKILSLFGSPHREGTSSRLHNVFLESFEGKADILRVHAYDKNINPCTACGYCRDRLDCIFRDDMNLLYEEFLSADFITISSPLYFSSLTGPLKILIDRCQALWEMSRRDKQPPGKRRAGLFIAVGGGNYHDMFRPAVTVIRHFFKSLGFEPCEEDYILIPNLDYQTEGDVPEAFLQKALEDRKSTRLNSSH